jgi:hypothetical protein
LPSDYEPHSHPQPARPDAYRLRLGPSPRAESVSPRLCRVTCSGTNGPFCRESLPYAMVIENPQDLRSTRVIPRVLDSR